MTDIDFDELDRAVSTLMTKHQASRPVNDPEPKPRDDETVLKIGDDLVDKDSQSDEGGGISTVPITSTIADEKSQPSPSVEPADTSASEASNRQADDSEQLADNATEMAESIAVATSQRVNLPSRRSGRFMDVVHPSSDMRSESTASSSIGAPAPRSSVSRNGLTVAPSSDQADQSLEDSDRPVVDAIVGPNSQVVDSADAVTESPSYEVSSFDMEDMLSPSPEVEASTSGEPLTTPFITDAKVDKRPLGRAATSPSVESEKSKPEDDETTQPSPYQPADQTEADDTQTAPNQVIQAELRSDLISLESDETTATSSDLGETDADSDDQAKQNEQTTSESQPQPVSKPLVQPTGPIAITQQYQEEPSSSPTESGSIYDTSDYHQPLAHPPKKHSGWMWVVWVLALLVLGAGSGAAAYFLLIQ